MSYISLCKKKSVGFTLSKNFIKIANNNRKVRIVPETGTARHEPRSIVPYISHVRNVWSYFLTSMPMPATVAFHATLTDFSMCGFRYTIVFY